MAKILVIDDDPDIRGASTTVLEREGHQVDQAGSRDEGMKKIEEFGPDLLILDVMMEQADDGIAMAQELRRKDFTKPILMVTGLSKVTGMDYGKDDSIVPVDAFLEKPLHPQELIDKVNELLK